MEFRFVVIYEDQIVPCTNWSGVSNALWNFILEDREYYKDVKVYELKAEVPYNISFNEPK